MFFFFAGGMDQAVREVLKSGAGRCIMCGSRADLVSYDNVLKLFFIPVWRWPGKQSCMYCNDCSLFFPRSDVNLLPPKPDALKCWSCATPIDPKFKFCPFCGSAL